jgi:phospholipase D1/2
MSPSPVSMIHYRHIVRWNLTRGLQGHPHLEQWKSMGRQYKQKWHGIVSDPPERPEQKPGRQSGYEGKPRPGLKLNSCRAQVIRSVSDWSHGVLTEHSIQDACEC